MESDILLRIIAAEKTIQQRLEEERRRAGEKIEAARISALASVSEEEERVKQVCTEQLARAEEAVRQEVSVILQTAAARAGRLAQTPDSVLTAAVIKHLHRILPREVP